MAISISSVMSLFFHGVVRLDYIFTAFICSFLIATVIAHIILSLTQEIKASEKALRKSNKDLSLAISEIKTLQGILPICSYCKNIRNDEGYYEQLEGYIHKHSGVDFSHTICPTCLKKHYREEYDSIMQKKEGELYLPFKRFQKFKM
ncbi:MAG: hypothetical protein MUO63_11130 [Desulfobulbaceae bacterium]|nr:hypothetical protein [Desulfobulbaceae bacterium]